MEQTDTKRSVAVSMTVLLVRVYMVVTGIVVPMPVGVNLDP